MVLIGAIILLHGIIPHVHFETEEVAGLHSHECRINLFEDIQISFGLDQGGGHFEHFVESDIDQNLFNGPDEVVNFQGIFTRSHYAPLVSNLFVGDPIPSDHLRGPPTGA